MNGTAHRFNKVAISEETLEKTRKWFADLYRGLAEDARSGKLRTQVPSLYIARQEENARRVLQGDDDRTFTFLQRAYYIQTGECVPLFSK